MRLQAKSRLLKPLIKNEHPLMTTGVRNARANNLSSDHVRICRKITDAFDLHPENRRIYQDMVAREPHEMYGAKIYEEVWDRSSPLGTKPCHLAVTDQEGHLKAFMPGMIYTRCYLDAFADPKIQKWFDRVRPFLNPFSRTLVFGNLMDHGVILTAEGVSQEWTLEQMIQGAEQAQRKYSLAAVSFKELDADQTSLHDILDRHSFLRFSGFEISSIDLRRFATFADYLDFIFGNSEHGWSAKDTPRLLEGNFIKPEMEPLLRRRKLEGFPTGNSVDLMAETTLRALKMSRRRQALVLLQDSSRAAEIPGPDENQRRVKFLDNQAEDLRQRGLLADLRYESYRSFQHLVPAIYPLFVEQYTEKKTKFPLPGADWFRRFETSDGSRLLYVVWRGEEPIGFHVAFHDQRIFNCIYIGMNSRFKRVHNLYFNQHIWMVYEAMRLGCHTVRLGPTTKVTKAKFGAVATPTRSFVKFYPPRILPFVGEDIMRWFGKHVIHRLIPDPLPDI